MTGPTLTFTTGSQEIQTSTAQCPSGQWLVGGGGRVSDPSKLLMVESNPLDGALDGGHWEATWRRASGFAGTATAFAYVVCS